MTSMRSSKFILGSLFAVAAVAFCQTQSTTEQLKQMLDASTRRGQLTTDGAQSFHLAASFEWVDQTGKPLGKGSRDELWESPRRYRQEITIPGKRLLEVDDSTRAWRTGEWVLPQLADLAIRSALTPFFEKPSGDRLSVEVVPRRGENFDCVGTEPNLAGVSQDVRIAVTTYCMAKGNHLLRLISRPNGIEIAFNDIQPFENKFVARTVVVAQKGGGVLRMHIDRLEPTANSDALREAPLESAQILGFHRADMSYLTGELMHAQLLTKVSPQYPQAGLRGKIVVKVHIDTTGSVGSMEVVSADNQVLKAPVLNALKQWKFRVAYQGGKAVEDEQIFEFQDSQDGTA
jgi:TonB family protein